MLPSSGFKIGRVLGIDIVINVTWLLIFALVAVSFGDLLRITYSQQIILNEPVRVYYPGGAWPWVAGFITAAVFFACLLMHELSHSFVAKRNGIEINRITLFIFGGVAEMKEDVKSPGTEFKMAIAGPVMSFMLAGVFYGFYYLTDSQNMGLWLVAPLFYLAWINLAVGVFNLLPGFPLDGGRILRSILWKTTGDIRKATRVTSIAGQVIAALIAGGGVYFVIVGNFIGGVWFLLIGMFLFRLAQNSYRQTLLRLAAADTKASDIMYTNIPVIESGTGLTVLRDSYFAVYHLPGFPVVESGRLVGVVTRDDLTRVSPAEWDIIDAGRIASPLTADIVVSPDTPLDRLLKPLMTGRQFLLVATGDQVQGLVTKEETLRYVQMRVKNTPAGG